MKFLYFLLAGLLFSPGAIAQNASLPDSTRSTGLFADTTVLRFTLTAPLQRLIKERADTTASYAAQLSYPVAQGEPLMLPVKLKVRGHFRRQWNVCSFPPLYLDLPKRRSNATVFANQNKLKLVTHCEIEEYVVREYLVYRLYNLLTDYSFRARLCKVTYVDSSGKLKPETRWAALLEDEDDMRKRNGGKSNKVRMINMPDVDSLSMATLGVFEYLIGNTDWSVPYRHNIRLLALPTYAKLVPVPYDFDHSGIVEAFYALPGDNVGVASVRERIYRGPLYSAALFQRVFERFNQLKPQFYALYQNDPRLDPAYRKNTLRYLDEFYAEINNPVTAQTIFRSGTRRNVAIKNTKMLPAAPKQKVTKPIPPTTQKPAVKKN